MTYLSKHPTRDLDAYLFKHIFAKIDENHQKESDNFSTVPYSAPLPLELAMTTNSTSGLVIDSATAAHRTGERAVHLNFMTDPAPSNGQ